jgi:RHS repeat-associated protein
MSANGPTAAANPFRYAGGYFDADTRLTKFGARYYDPNVGRWTHQDP